MRIKSSAPYGFTFFLTIFMFLAITTGPRIDPFLMKSVEASAFKVGTSAQDEGPTLNEQFESEKQDDVVRVWVSHDLMREYAIQKVEPEAARVTLHQKGILHEFEAKDVKGDHVTFHLLNN